MSSTDVERASTTSSENYLTRDIPIDVHFKRRFRILKILGVYLGNRKDDGTYTFTIGSLLTAYIIWYVVPMLTFIGAEVWYDIQETEDQDLANMLKSPIFVTVCVILPLLKSHSLNTITNTLRKSMKRIPTLSDLNASLTNSKGGMESDSTDGKENRKWNCHGETTLLGAGTISSCVFLVYWIYGLMVTAEEIFSKMMEEFPVFMVDVIYQILPLITTMFMVTFLQYYAALYRVLQTDLLKLCADWTSVGLEELSTLIENTQDTFRDLLDGFLQYALTLNTVIVVYLATFTTYRLSLGVHEVIYLIPAALGAIQVFLIAYHARCLTYEGEQLLIKTRHEAREFRQIDVAKANALRLVEALLQKSPPIVRFYGGIPFGYGILPIIAVFLLVYTGLYTSSKDIGLSVSIDPVLNATLDISGGNLYISHRY